MIRSPASVRPAPRAALLLAAVAVAACSAPPPGPGGGPARTPPLVAASLPSVTCVATDELALADVPPAPPPETHRRYAVRLASLPIATATLRTEAAKEGRSALSLRAELAPMLGLFEDSSLAVDVVVAEDRRPLRAVTRETRGDSARRTLLAFDDGSSSVVVKETLNDRSRVRLLQSEAPWEPLSLAEAVAHLPFEGESRSFEVLLAGLVHRLTVRADADAPGGRHLRGAIARAETRSGDLPSSSPGPSTRPTPIEAWFDADGRLERATLGTPVGALELVRVDD